MSYFTIAFLRTFQIQIFVNPFLSPPYTFSLFLVKIKTHFVYLCMWTNTRYSVSFQSSCCQKDGSHILLLCSILNVRLTLQNVPHFYGIVYQVFISQYTVTLVYRLCVSRSLTLKRLTSLPSELWFDSL
jgi:hypothetical protein